jgi:hypothetical protein
MRPPRLQAIRVLAGHRHLLTAAAAALLALACLGALLRVTMLDSLGGVRLGAAEWAMSDFKSILYYPGRAFLDGANPYDTEQYLARYPAPAGFYVYPPLVFIFALPFAVLPLEGALLLKVATTLVLTAVLAVACLRLAGARGRLAAVLFVMAVVFLSRPGQWSLLLGQVTTPLVLATYAALVLGRRRALLAGCALALCLVKPNFGMPLAAIMLARGQVRAVATGVALIVLLNLPLVALMIERAGDPKLFLVHALGGGEPLSHVEELHAQLNYHRVDLVALVSQFLTTSSLGLLGTALLGATVLGLVIIGVRRLEGSAADVQAEWPAQATAGLILTGMLLCGYHLTYDLLLLAWPFTALVVRIAATGRDSPPRHWLALGLFTLLAGNYLTTGKVIEELRSFPVLALTLASLNGAALTILFGLYFYEVIRLRAALEQDGGRVGRPTSARTGAPAPGTLGRSPAAG